MAKIRKEILTVVRPNPIWDVGTRVHKVDPSNHHDRKNVHGELFLNTFMTHKDPTGIRFLEFAWLAPVPYRVIQLDQPAVMPKREFYADAFITEDFVVYGVFQFADGVTIPIRSPDFNWSKFTTTNPQ